MARRLPGIRQRMEDTAIELYAKQGLAATTARQIAEAAGTTERTFFRHFRDKADAAFGDESRLRAAAADLTRAADPEDLPLAAAIAGMTGLAAEFDQRRAVIIRRARFIAAEPALRDREYGRTWEWVETLTDALCDRGERRELAVLPAALALTTFRVAFEQWVEADGTVSLRAHFRRRVKQLPTLL